MSTSNFRAPSIEDFNRAIELNPNDAHAYGNRGNFYRDLGQHQRAIEDHDKAIELDRFDPTTYYNRGNSYSDLGQHRRAIEDYDIGISLFPYDPLDYHRRGNSYDDLGQYQRAIEDYDKAIELDPNFGHAYGNRGISYDNLGQHQRATEDHDKAIELEPNDPTAYYNQGNSYRDLGQYQRAIEDHDKAIELDPNFAYAYGNRGNSYLDLGQHQRAIEDHDKAIELDPNDARTYHNRGHAYRDLGQYQRAIEDYDKVIDLYPDDPQIYYNRGISYSNLGQYQRAVEDFDKAIDLDPNDAEARTLRQRAVSGLTDRQRTDLEETSSPIPAIPDSRSRYVEALRSSAEPSYIVSRDSTGQEISGDVSDMGTTGNVSMSPDWGHTLMITGRYDEAVSHFTGVLELHPDDLDAIQSRGRTLLVLAQVRGEPGKYNADFLYKALDDFNHFMALRRDDPEALFFRGLALEALERKDEALADFDRALDLITSDGPRATSEGPIYPDIADVLDCRAKILLKMARYDRTLFRFDHHYNQALADFDRAQNLRTRNADPNVLSLLYGFAATYTLMGFYQPALECLERAIAGDAQYRTKAGQEADFGSLRSNPQYSRQFDRLLGGT